MNQVERKRQQIECCSYAAGLIVFLLLGRRYGSAGIAFLGVGLECFLLVWSLCGGAMADALGRLLRSRMAKGQYKNGERLRFCALFIQILTGLLGSVVLLFLGQIPRFGFVLALFAPAVFLRGVSAVFFGYFQGEGTELPRTVCNILRQILLLGFGWLFGGMLASYGEKVSELLGRELFTAMYAAGGVALAFSVSEIFLILFLLLIYKGSRKPKKEEKEGLKTVDSWPGQAGALYGAMWSRMVIFFMGSFPVVLGTWLLLRGDGGELYLNSYGIFLGSYLLPVLVAGLLLCAGLLPAISKLAAGYRREETRAVRACFQGGLHGAMLFGAFFTVFGTVMAEQLSASMISDTGAVYLQQGSALLILLVLGYYFARILLYIGQTLWVLLALLLGNVAYGVGLFVLLGAEGSGVESLLYAGLLGCGISCVLLGVLTCRKLKVMPDVLSMLIVPVAASGVAGLLSMLLGRLLTPHIGNPVTVLVCLATSGFVFLIVILVVRNVKEQELGAMPLGGLLRTLGQLLHVF